MVEAADSSDYTSYDRKRRIAEKLLYGEAKPVTNWAEGLNELAKGFFGGKMMRDADQGEKQADQSFLDANLPNSPVSGVAAALSAPQGGGPQTSQNPEAEKQAVDYFVKQGYAPHQAAGIVGNLSAESGLNTGAINPNDGRDGSNSIGIAQWNGPRAAAFKQFASSKGLDPNDLNTQLAFTNEELNTTEKASGDRIRSAKNAEEATAAAIGYERPAGYTPQNPQGGMAWDKRLGTANRLAGGPVKVASLDPTSGMQAPPTQTNTVPTGKDGVVQALAGSPSNAPPSNSPVQNVAQALSPPQSNSYGLTPDQVNQLRRDPKRARKIIETLQLEQFKNQAKGAEGTDDIKEFNLAKSQGFTGTLQDWIVGNKKAGATNVNVNGGGSDKQIFDSMQASADKANTIAAGLDALRQAKIALKSGIISGAGADARLGLQKIGALLGAANPDTIQNTETFRAAIAPQVAAMLRSTVGSANISNSDREFAEKAAGGNINLDDGSINRLVDIMEKSSIKILKTHQKRLNDVYSDPEANKRERALFNVDFSEDAPVAPTALPQGVPEGEKQDPVEPQPKVDITSITPKVGEIRKGHKFLGGDPSDQNSWQVIQ